MHKQVQYLKFDEACELVSLINSRKYLQDTRYKILAHLTRICALWQTTVGPLGGRGTWLTNSFKCFHCCHYKFARVAAEQRRAAAAAADAVCKSQHFVNLIAALCKLSGSGRGIEAEAGVEVVAQPVGRRGRLGRHSQDDLVTHSRRCHCLPCLPSLSLSLCVCVCFCLPIASATSAASPAPLSPFPVVAPIFD